MTFERRTVHGNPAAKIIEIAKSSDIDLIVLGTHGRSGIAHFFMGSVAERVVQLADCPVLTVHNSEHDFVTADTTSEAVCAL